MLYAIRSEGLPLGFMLEAPSEEVAAIRAATALERLGVRLACTAVFAVQPVLTAPTGDERSFAVHRGYLADEVTPT